MLTAPGHIVHGVREALSKQAGERVVGTMPKDFTKVPDHELTEHLAEWWMGLPDTA